MTRSRGHEFLSIFTSMEEYLARHAPEGGSDSWSDRLHRLAKINKAAKRYLEDLLAYGRLRNAIVHSSLFPDAYIAEPLPQVVDHFRTIVQHITSPVRLKEHCAQQEDIRVFDRRDLLKDALKYMRDNDFSQVIVRVHNELSLITAEEITRWLEHQINDDGIVVDISETTLEVLEKYEMPGSSKFMSEGESLFDAEDAFQQPPAPNESRLYAIVVTSNGRPTGELRGIVTAWDVLAIGDA
jgi:CBS domain-containing protein